MVAAVRSAVIGPASMIAMGTVVTGSLSSRRPKMPARPAALLAGFPDTHFIPSRSAEPSRAWPGSSAGMAWANDAWRPRVHPDLGRQLGARRQSAERGLGEVEPLGQ